VPSGSFLKLEGVVKRYHDQVAVAGMSLDVAEGEFITLLGPSGSGKTTTLNMIAGFTRPSEGAIVLEGRHIESVPSHKRGIGVVFQDYALFPHMTVAENVAFPLRQRRLSRAETETKTRETLALVNLADYSSRYPSQLSGGQRQRVAVARAIVFGPRLLLMDEPLGALDRALRERLQVELRRLHRELGVTILYVTHDQTEAFGLSDRIAVCNEGLIEQVGGAEELYKTPETLFVAQFLGESNVFMGTLVESGEAPLIRHGDHRLRGSPTTLPVDQSTALVVRPESVRIQAAHADVANHTGHNRLPGTIKEIRYFGSELKVWVELTDGSLAIARYQGDERPAAMPGDLALLEWPVEAGVLLATGGTQPLASSPSTMPDTSSFDVQSTRS
jgi:putative spermidine/putrescine transport system ATP-binding protein